MTASFARETKIRRSTYQELAPEGPREVIVGCGRIVRLSMYCKKCGAKIHENARHCSACGAETGQIQGKGSAKNSRNRIVVASAGAAVILIAIAAIVAERSGMFGSRVKASNSADLAASFDHVQAHSWNAASAIIPDANLLYLPHADTGFVGTWGGTVHVVSVSGQGRPATTGGVPMSYLFGERNGEVFLKTRVYGDPIWPVVKSAVKVLSPKSVEFTLNSVCASCMPPVSQTETTRLTLIANDKLSAECETYAFASGGGHVDVKYAGTLHPLTPQELEQLDAKVREEGKLLTTIDSKSRVGG